jgi:signal transduction histidine kinase
MQSRDLKAQLKKLERQLLTVYAFGFVVIAALSVVSNSLMKDQAARQATSMIQRTVAQDPREAVLTLNDAKLDYFTAVVYFGPDGKRIFSLPSNLDPDVISHPSLWEKLGSARIETDLIFDVRSKKKIGSVLYIFDRFSHVKWAFFIWVSFMLATLPLVRNSRISITENYKRDMTLREESTRAELAQRVRHDIRSPLGALKVATRDLANLTERRKRIIQKATTRIDEIVAELELIRSIGEGRDSSAALGGSRSVSLLPIVQDILQEKKTSLQDRGRSGLRPSSIFSEFSPDSFFLFSLVDSANLKRTLSNVIENAIEVCGENEPIHVRLNREGQWNLIEVRDEGSGIAAENLLRVTEKGFTLGKKNGTGRGLYYAKRDIEAVGGKLEIESKLGSGTLVRIVLPALDPPAWYRRRLELPRAGTIVIVDDQESSRLTLRERIEEFTRDKAHPQAQLRIESFSSRDELMSWHASQLKASGTPVKSLPILYLLDFDLGSGKKTGLDLAEELELSENAVLVTGHFDLKDVQDRCAQLGIGLIPKSYLSEIEISFA